MVDGEWQVTTGHTRRLHSLKTFCMYIHRQIRKTNQKNENANSTFNPSIQETKAERLKVLGQPEAVY